MDPDLDVLDPIKAVKELKQYGRVAKGMEDLWSHGGADLTRRRIAEMSGEALRVHRLSRNWQNVSGSVDGTSLAFARRDCDQ